MRSRFSRRAATEETVDVETAVRMLITRLQESGKAKGIDPNQISRDQLTGLIDRLASPERPPRQGKNSESSAGHTNTLDPPGGLEITLTTRLTRETGEPMILTPNGLSRNLAPYLNAIISIQNIFNEVKGLPLRKISILEIHTRPVMTIRLDGAAEAIFIIKSIINAWRQRNHEQITRISTGTLRSHIEKTTLDRSKVEMASQMLDLVKAGMREKEKFNYLSSLLPSIDILIYSEYELS